MLLLVLLQVLLVRRGDTDPAVLFFQVCSPLLLLLLPGLLPLVLPLLPGLLPLVLPLLPGLLPLVLPLLPGLLPLVLPGDTVHTGCSS